MTQLLVSVPFKNPTWLYLGNFPLQIETNENIFYKYRFRQLNMYSHSTNVISELGCRAVYISHSEELWASVHTQNCSVNTYLFTTLQHLLCNIFSLSGCKVMGDVENKKLHQRI